MNVIDSINFKSMVEVFCIPLIISVFALAFPILLQTASRIEDKYKRIRLVNSFYRESINIIFIVSIISSLLSIVIWFLKFPRNVDWGIWLNFLIENSAFIFVFVNSVLLVVLLFLFIRLIKIYYDPLRLSERLEKKYDKEEE